jgi:hypothetical protein
MASQPSEFDSAGQPAQPDQQLELLLADSWNTPLWKRLLGELRDRLSPEKLPPLRLTSRPVNVGMLASDMVSLPWYRTVFTSLGDVISPEVLPPLELESRPEDVGELIADQMAHPWWTSLLRNLADAVAPERQPPLQLTSAPADPGMVAGALTLPRWSSVISTPKVFLPDKPKAEYAPIVLKPIAPRPKPDAAEIEFVHTLERDLRKDLWRSQLRQRLWVSLAVLEFAALIFTSLFWK